MVLSVTPAPPFTAAHSVSFRSHASLSNLNPKTYMMLDELAKKISAEKGEVGEEEGLLVKVVILSH